MNDILVLPLRIFKHVNCCSNSSKSKSIPQIAIPMFNYTKYRNSTLIDELSNSSTGSSVC